MVRKRGGTVGDETQPFPNFHRGRLEEYARAGFRRVAAIIEQTIQRDPRYGARCIPVRERGTCDLTLDLLVALSDGGCLAPIAAGISEQNERDTCERHKRRERRNSDGKGGPG